jgi:hypothetical protein
MFPDRLLVSRSKVIVRHIARTFQRGGAGANPAPLVITTFIEGVRSSNNLEETVNRELDETLSARYN